MAGPVRTFLFKLVLENAIEAEEKAYNFYEHRISRVQDAEVQELLKRLASIELKHRLKLEEVQRESSLGRLEVSHPETAARLENINRDWPEIGPESTVREVLEAALKKEQDAFSFYTTLQHNAPVRSVKEIFAALASEEKSHVDWITGRLAKEAPVEKTENDENGR
jgi:rubrerythrin